MNELDNENRILELFRKVPTEKVCILFNDEESQFVYESLVFRKDNWIDNSAKSSPPPDYLNPTERIMLEIMRVNDTDSDMNRGESRLQQELLNSGILELFPNVQTITCIPDVHSQSYEKYCKSFVKTVENHNSKIEKYKANHPEINRVVFMICDESEAYYEVQERTEIKLKARVHFWFYDNAFMQVLKNTNVDTVIWFSPYKVLERDGINFPDVVVINPRLIDVSKLECYISGRMVDATQVQRIDD